MNGRKRMEANIENMGWIASMEASTEKRSDGDAARIADAGSPRAVPSTRI